LPREVLASSGLKDPTRLRIGPMRTIPERTASIEAPDEPNIYHFLYLLVNKFLVSKSSRSPAWASNHWSNEMRGDRRLLGGH